MIETVIYLDQTITRQSRFHVVRTPEGDHIATFSHMGELLEWLIDNDIGEAVAIDREKEYRLTVEPCPPF